MLHGCQFTDLVVHTAMVLAGTKNCLCVQHSKNVSFKIWSCCLLVRGLKPKDTLYRVLGGKKYIFEGNSMDWEIYIDFLVWYI